MPTYIQRTLQDYPKEFYRCSINPEGLEFACVFCPTFYKTKWEYISHMKECCREEDMEYTDELEIEENITIYDHHRNHASESTTIQNFLRNNELASFSDIHQILEQIQARLIENGFNSTEFYVYTTSFSIYKFFFMVSAEEVSEFRRRCAENIMNDIQAYLKNP